MSIESEILKEQNSFSIRKARKTEYKKVGDLLVQVYSVLNGFPKIQEQPEYYDMLKEVGKLTANPGIEIIVAISEQNKIGGAVVYYNDMKDYGSGGTATKQKMPVALDY